MKPHLFTVRMNTNQSLPPLKTLYGNKELIRNWLFIKIIYLILYSLEHRNSTAIYLIVAKMITDYSFKYKY
jgi:hypothetical protein